MMPQSNFMVVAPIVPAKIDALKSLLATMNAAPGMAKPDNAVVPFGEFERLHFARFVILENKTLGDFAELGEPIPNFPVALAFMADFDGAREDFIEDLAGRAGPGLRQIFGHCEGFLAETDLLEWMKARSVRPATAYVNWRGRTVRQIREEAALRAALLKYIHAHADTLSNENPQQVRRALIAHVEHLRKSGQLVLTPPEPTPLGWLLCHIAHFLIVPVGLAVAALALVVVVCLLPLLLIPLALAVLAFVMALRWHEKTEIEVIKRPDADHVLSLAALEDHDVSNQFNALGSVKLGLFRRWLSAAILWAIDWAARHFFARGHLGRIRTIHFARWVFLDDKRRLVFASNYDGSHEAYMDDFINKAGWGLNLAFGGGVGYPRTRWLIGDGAKHEMKFKHTQRRHQVASQVWYKAYPGLTAFDLARNARVRSGVERQRMTDADVRGWLSDL